MRLALGVVLFYLEKKKKEKKKKLYNSWSLLGPQLLEKKNEKPRKSPNTAKKV